VTPFLLRRLLHALTVVFLVTTVTFVIVHAAPGGPAILADPKLGPVERAEIEARLGLDRPLPVQYATWMGSVVRGDLGRSFLYQTPNVETILQRLPNTLLLAGSALVLTLVLAIPLGLYAAARPGSLADRVLATFSFVSMAIPTFWLALLLMILFGLKLGWLPLSGLHSLTFAELSLPAKVLDICRHLVLPVVISAFTGLAGLSRFTRSSMLEVIRQDYIRTAYAKGMPAEQVILKHAVRNALLPVVTILGLSLPALIGGGFIFETIFAYPGMGRLGYEAIMARDYPVVMAVGTIAAVLTLLGNLLADLTYAWVDPRIRYK
jgi:peptide/nickel transport system permease protein